MSFESSLSVGSEYPITFWESSLMKMVWAFEDDRIFAYFSQFVINQLISNHWRSASIDIIFGEHGPLAYIYAHLKFQKKIFDSCGEIKQKVKFK